MPLKTSMAETDNCFKKKKRDKNLPNEGRLKSLLCKNINMFVNFSEIGIYLKYCTPHPLRD